MGDFVDRGQYSTECMCLLMAWKIKYPKNLYMTRGNHESTEISRAYGFYDECKRRYTISLWREYCEMFNYLPIAAIVDERILCMHGGLSPVLNRKLRNKQSPLTLINTEIKRPCGIPTRGLLCDLLWSDPDSSLTDVDWKVNERGASFTFSKNIVKKFCDDNDLDLICRAH